MSQLSAPAEANAKAGIRALVDPSQTGGEMSPMVQAQARALFDAHRQQIFRATDRLFIGLMLLQWLGGIIAACWISPKSWEGPVSSTHPHVWAAIFLGGAIASLPIAFALVLPGAAITRHCVAVSQMSFSALLIHLSGGRIETHFHVFGSLAFLAFYREWQVLVTATVVVLIDHLTRGAFWPQSVYGVLVSSGWRSVEHAGWVVFEDVFLGWACFRNVQEMWRIAGHRAQLEATNTTLERFQKELRDAKEAAESANVAKSEFLARMSHEIRTPLNGVVGMIDLLHGTGMSETQQRYARLARDASQSLQGVINDILDFSKIEAGKVEIERTEFDLHGLVEDLTELLGPVAARKNLALACFLRPDVPRHVIGDSGRVRQVLTNLISNAIKFTSHGRVCIRASIERREGDEIEVRVQVEDSGIGIPPERIDRLFKSFSQVDSSTTRKFGGTGLGLVICKRLVELMGGQIGVRNSEPHGTTFWFTLKLTAMAPRERPTESNAPRQTLRDARVLAVEPDSVYRQIFHEQFDGRFSSSSNIVGIEGAMETLVNAAAQGSPFDVALIPGGTPEGDRLRAAIRSDERLEQTRLIAVIEAGSAAGAPATTDGLAACLHRPLTQSKVLDALASMLDPGAVAAVDGDPDSAHQAFANPQESMSGLHLLVAEDNEMNRFVTTEILSRMGCTCETVGDGAQAVEAVRQKSYDMVLMDCQMPEMDGLEATRRIREWEAASSQGLRRLPIIALTADALDGDRERSLAAGMDAHVTKPIDSNELQSTMRSLMTNLAIA